jgi:hypothetical protein
MSMYLPNPDLSPTGFEPVEFIDVPVEATKVTGEPSARTTQPDGEEPASASWRTIQDTV